MIPCSVDSPSTSDDPSSRTERTEFGKTKYANPFIFCIIYIYISASKRSLGIKTMRRIIVSPSCAKLSLQIGSPH